jgi:TonB family protein
LSTYDAPELARGQITPAADVWSLGVTLVEALTQRLPVWDMAKSVEPLLPPGLPEPFAEIVRHSLQRDPGWRWTVEQIQARLGHPSTASEPGFTAAVAPLPAAGSRRRFGRLAALVLLALAVIVIGLWVFHSRPQPQPAAPTPGLTETVQAQPEPPAEPARENVPPAENAGAPSSAAPAPAAPAPRPEPATRAAAAAETVPGAVVEQVLPDVSQKARQSIHGSFNLGVKLRVDPAGKVVDARLASPGTSKYFAAAALDAARRWKFRPPRVGDRSVASEWLLRFQFERTGTTVKPQPVAP